MTCVRQGSLVEMFDRDHNVDLREIERIRPGDLVRDPLSGRSAMVVTTLSQETGGLWPLVQYMGLSADVAQSIFVPGRGWITAGDIGTRSLQLCPRIYALVLSNGKTVRIDGITCCAHTPADLSSTTSSSATIPEFSV